MNRYGDVEKYRNFFKVCERVNNHPDTVRHAENTSIFDLEKAQHVVGWCSEVRNYAGKNNVKISKGLFLLT